MKITLHRTEGPRDECVTKTHESLAAAEHTIRRWARTAPVGGGYDKVDVSIVIDDDHAFGFRFDMDRDHATAPCPIEREAISHCDFLSRRFLPYHMTPAIRDRVLADMGVDDERSKFYGECAEALRSIQP